jgi:hypothetical protein
MKRTAESIEDGGTMEVNFGPKSLFLLLLAGQTNKTAIWDIPPRPES